MSAEHRGLGIARTLRPWLAAGIGVVLAGVLATAVVAYRADDGSDLIAAIDKDPLVRVADIASAEGSPGKGVYVQLTRTGHFCIWEAPSATSRERGGGCNTADDPLNGRPLSFTLSYDGGQAIADVKGATLFGLTSMEVARASVLMSDGSTREIRLRDIEVAGDDYRAFGFRFKKADLRKGIGPTAVVAIDETETEIDRQSAGIGG